MIDNTKEYILCAAIRRVNRRVATSHLYHEGQNDILDIELGMRHHDIYMRFPGELSKSPYAQGFYTSKGRFVDRWEGMKIAVECGQVSKTKGLKTKESEERLNELMPDSMFVNVIDTSNENPSLYKDIYYQLFSEDLY